MKPGLFLKHPHAPYQPESKKQHGGWFGDGAGCVASEAKQSKEQTVTFRAP
jgi:hypothetical protein